MLPASLRLLLSSSPSSPPSTGPCHSPVSVVLLCHRAEVRVQIGLDACEFVFDAERLSLNDVSPSSAN